MTGHPIATLREGKHRYGLRVYYEDTDAGGIVYHATYLRFAERARTEALRDLGVPHAEMEKQFGLMFVVRSVKVEYELPARLDQWLTVETSALEIGGASLLLRQDVLGPDGPCAILTVRLACVSGAGGRPGETPPGGHKSGAIRPGRMPPRWRTALAALRDTGRADGTEKGNR
jgi:acyl-CoA thioester hydrolase